MSKRDRYFIKQKLFGLACIIGGLASVPILEGTLLLALIFVPAGIGMMITNKMVLTDEYFLEEKYGKKDEES